MERPQQTTFGNALAVLSAGCLFNVHDEDYRTTMKAVVLLFIGAEGSGSGGNLKGTLEVLLFPVTLIGGLLSAGYSYVLIKNGNVGAENQRAQTEKTKLETEKLRRELASSKPAAPSDVIAQPEPTPARQLLRNPTVESIVLRFIALELFARLWGAIAQPATATLNSFSPIGLLGFRQIQLNTLAGIAFWIFAAPLAFSIFADLNSALGIRIRDFTVWSSSNDPAARRRALYFLGAIATIVILPFVLVLTIYNVVD